MKNKNQIVIYQGKNGEIKFKGDFKKDTIWGTQKQIAILFNTKRPAITKHLNNIFKSKELKENSVCSILEHTAKDGKKYKTKFYNLDAIIAVGYRVNSKKATQFRIWATKTLKQHLTKGYTINKKRISHNYESFIKAVENVKALLPRESQIKNQDILELIKVFADTWVSLNAYDKDELPKKGITKKQIKFTSDELSKALLNFKNELIKKKQATDIFGQEKNMNSIKGIIGNIFQSFNKKDVYPTIEQKAANLLYFIVKNHPFIDGNKRSGAFAFVWFMRKAGILRASFSSEALTALTLLVAQSNPKDKEKMIGLILLILKR